MSSFKEQMAKDLDVFINLDEFANWHFIGSIDYEKKIKCIVDTNESTTPSYNRGSSFDDNVFNCDLIVRYKFSDFEVNIRAHIDGVVFDDIDYNVVHFSCDDGMVELKLNRKA